LGNFICIEGANLEISLLKKSFKERFLEFIRIPSSGEAKLGSLAGKYNGKRCPTTYYWQYGLMVGTVLDFFHN
jgi:hypothetical protein